MKNKSIYWFVLTIILSSLVFILGTGRKSLANEPVTVYEVYLNGESLGVIEDETELYELIDREQQTLKKKFNVNKIYAPIGLETTKIVTYQGEIETVNSIYDKIKDIESFTVKGYEVTITYSEDKKETINILNKADFDTSIENTIKAFVDEEQYKKYLESKQDKIVETGSIIENVKIKENITIKEKYISTNDKIFTNSTDLSKYMLFGPNESEGVHIVNAGETIKEIAEEYELNTRELLIVNPNLTSENTLLFAGQKLNVGLINPIVSVVVENTLIEDKKVTYKSEVKYDNKYVVGTTYTEQKGQNGVSRVEYYTETINGVITQVVPVDTKVITPVINEVIVKGGLSINYVGDSGNWAWPTIQPYKITSHFGWRTDPVFGGREYHRGVDIAGTGYGSPIYAAKEGVVSQKGYKWDMGNYLYIEHDKGYRTIYMHLSDFVSGIRVGSHVEKGEQVGYMGSTGKSTGTHLDFRVVLNGNYINPLDMYK